MKHFTLILSLLFAFTIHAQSYVGSRPELLVGKQVKIKKPVYGSDYFGFFTEYTANKRVRHKGDRPALENRIFNVEKLDHFGPDGAFKILTLKDDKETLYYQYDKNDYFFEVIGGIDYPEDYFSEFIPNEIAADGYKEWSLNKNKGLTITKEINIATGKEEYEFVIHLTGSAKVDKGKGVTIHLENDKNIELPNEIVAKSHQGRYIAFVVLDKKMIDLLVNNSIKAIKLVGQTDQVSSETAIILKGGLKNLLKIK